MRHLQLKIPPMLLFFACLAIAWLLARSWPELSLAVDNHLIFLLPAVVGALLCFIGVWTFRRARTTMNPIKPDLAQNLIVSGIYHYSRNPIYLGFLLIIIAWTLYLANTLALVTVPLFFVAYMNLFQIIPEEQALRQRFGAAFEDYQNSVRRWL